MSGREIIGWEWNGHFFCDNLCLQDILSTFMEDGMGFNDLTHWRLSHLFLDQHKSNFILQQIDVFYDNLPRLLYARVLAASS